MNSYLQSPARDLPASLSFYQKLQFQTVNEEDPSVVAQSGVAVLLNPDNFARPGLVMHRESWDREVVQLEKTRRVHAQPDGHLVADPSGVWIYLKTTATPVSSLPDTGSILGKYAGVCLETADIQRSLDLYQTLGFETDKGDAEQGWVACKNGDGMEISLMGPCCCPHLFFNPSLTYFNGGQNLPVIQAIREAEIPIAEEITHFNEEGVVDNVVLRDPGGLGMFIFND
jgi:catechol 2,3-dioxygenase-like lactoylglutathione lyase family enzyme